MSSSGLTLRWPLSMAVNVVRASVISLAAASCVTRQAVRASFRRLPSSSGVSVWAFIGPGSSGHLAQQRTIGETVGELAHFRFVGAAQADQAPQCFFRCSRIDIHALAL